MFTLKKVFAKPILSIFLASTILFTTSTYTPTTVTNAAPNGADIYVLVSDDSGTRFSLKSNGDGTFGSLNPFAYSDGSTSRGGGVADFDNDGVDVDFVTCSNFFSQCSLRKQIAPGVFEEPGTLVDGVVPMVQEQGLAVEDFNQDGSMDFVIGDEGSGGMYLLTNNGSGDFTGTYMSVQPIQPVRAKDAADIDGNGYPDLVVGSFGIVELFLNNGGNFNPSVILPITLYGGDDILGIATADFDGDGYIDIIAGGDSSGDISLWKGDGTGGFTLSHSVHNFGSPAAIDNYDFDGDGDQDLVASVLYLLEVNYLENLGDGTFAPPVLLGNAFNLSGGIATPPAPPIRSTIAGMIFNDQNGNGVDDDGLPGLPNATLKLTGTDYLGNAVSMTDDSDVDGMFEFKDVPNDNGNGYSLTVLTPPAGFAGTTPDPRAVSIPVANTLATEDFGFVEASEVSGTVFDDKNGNGVEDDGALGWNNVQITLRGNDSQEQLVDRVVQTNSSGDFTVGNLPLSNGSGYTVFVSGEPTGAQATTTVSQTVTVLLGGTEVTDVDFGYVGDSEVSGTVFNDVNANGVYESEDPIGNVTLNLTGTDFQGNAVDETVISSTVDGTFSIAGLKLSDASGYTLMASGAPPMFTPTTAEIRGVLINQGGSDITEDFGYVEDPQLMGFVFSDPNANGLNDDDAGGIEGVDLTLTGTDFQGNPVNAVTSSQAGSGMFMFADIKLSDSNGYTLAVSNPPAGFSATTSELRTVFLSTGGQATSEDFGYFENAKVIGTIYQDVNGNGQRDESGGLEDVTVTLVGETITGQGLSLSTQTDENGDYEFIDLNLSNGAGYTVAVSTPTGMLATTDTSANFVVNTAGQTETVDVGFVMPSDVSGIVFDDVDADGLNNDGGMGWANVVLGLSGTAANGSVISLSFTTSSDGLFDFTNLLPADASGYTLAVTTPPADTIATTVESAVMMIDQGGVSLTQEFGYQIPPAVASCSDPIHVHLDTENSDLYDVDLLTGLGSLTVSYGETFTASLGANPAGILHAFTKVGGNTANLVRLNANGSVTTIGATGFTGGVPTLTYDIDGSAYAINAADDGLYSINPSTGAATKIVDLPYNHGGGDLIFDAAGNIVTLNIDGRIRVIDPVSYRVKKAGWLPHKNNQSYNGMTFDGNFFYATERNKDKLHKFRIFPFAREVVKPSGGPFFFGDGASCPVTRCADDDGDGVCNNMDVCADTVVPEGVPTEELKPNHYALVDDDRFFDTTPPPGNPNKNMPQFHIGDTRGCSCEQILDFIENKNTHRFNQTHLPPKARKFMDKLFKKKKNGMRKHGCSVGLMKTVKKHFKKKGYYDEDDEDDDGGGDD